MTIKGEIPRTGGGSDYFELPDPKPGEMISGRLQILPNVWRKITWAPSHMIDTGGAGRVYLKHEAVGKPISAANLPKIGTTGTLTDTDSGTIIHVTRTR